MKRRDFLKSVGAVSAIGASSASAIDLGGESILSDDDFVMNASHYGALWGKEKNGRFEILKEFEGDKYPSSMLQGIVARTYDPSRITAPCVRESYLKKGYKADPSLRGKEKFVEITWEEAYDLIAKELKRVYKDFGYPSVYGGSVGWYGVGNVNNPQALVGRMLQVAGGYCKRSYTYSAGAISVITPHVTGTNEAFVASASWDNICKNTEVFVLWGSDMINTNQIGEHIPTHHQYEDFKNLKDQIKKRGLKVINIDPIQTTSADYYDAEHIAPYPNTDVALMLGIAYHLADKGLADQEFLKKYTSGYAQFEEYLFGKTDNTPKTPAWASKICGIDEAKIKELAELFASKRTMLHSGWALQRNDHGEQPCWMMITLAAMLGQIGLPGGGYDFALHYEAQGSKVAKFPGLEAVAGSVSAKGEWSTREIPTIPCARIVDCIKNPGKEIEFNGKKIKYPDFRMIYWAGGNPVHHHQDVNQLIKALRSRIETFVMQDCFWTATAKMADIVLPATLECERNDIAKASNGSYIFAIKPIVKPWCNAKDDYEIYSNILKRFDKAAYDAFTEGNEDSLSWVKTLYERSVARGKEMGIDMPNFEEFWKKGYVEFELPKEDDSVRLAGFIQNPMTNRLGTPSGKIEIFSRKIAKFNYKECRAYPSWFEPVEWHGDKNAKDYPLSLVSPHPKYRLHAQLNNTWLRDLEEVQEREPAWINPQDAKKYGIKNGDIIKVSSKRGSILAGAIVTDKIRQGAIRIQEGSWYDPLDWSKNDSLEVHGAVNVLTVDKSTSELAQACCITANVKIEKFKGVAPLVKAFEPPIIIKKG
ncbi:molybdopterin-dependent oxidoreductase [Campylobacter curvus]|uniref:molybdopterin-dependent oxidoreductase n=1 Tax=Campylobacter curvus TaxID=200 RepID=UPI001470840D|nr:molybdopterin-dependent oxidoreductase [Campylobacter curvus]